MTLDTGLARTRPSVLPAAAVLASLLAGLLVPTAGYARSVLTAALLVAVSVLVVRAPRAALYLLLVWLAAFALLRRLLTSADFSGQVNDPLLLFAPAAWLLLAATAVGRGALQERTPLTRAVLALTALLTLSALNPLQGGLAVGVAGLLLVVPPMLAFWVGRTLVDDRTLRAVLVLVAVLALPAAGYGLLQTFSGFPSWDARWIAERGYTALQVGGDTRAFSSFASGAEYAGYLALAAVVWVAFGRRVLLVPVTAGAVALLSVALWYESSRGIIVILVATLGLMLAVRRRLPLPLAIAAVALVLLALPSVVRQLAPGTAGGGTGASLVAHQVEGLSDPFGEESTLPGRITGLTGGLKQAVVTPVGLGVGTITSAAKRYSGRQLSTETDLGNVPVAVGALGLVAYLAITYIGLTGAYTLARRRRDALVLAALGVLAVTALQWLNGAQYAVAPLPWLVLGWLDRPQQPAAHLEGTPTA